MGGGRGLVEVNPSAHRERVHVITSNFLPPTIPDCKSHSWHHHSVPLRQAQEHLRGTRVARLFFLLLFHQRGEQSLISVLGPCGVPEPCNLPGKKTNLQWPLGLGAQNTTKKKKVSSPPSCPKSFHFKNTIMLMPGIICHSISDLMQPFSGRKLIRGFN